MHFQKGYIFKIEQNFNSILKNKITFFSPQLNLIFCYLHCTMHFIKSGISAKLSRMIFLAQNRLRCGIKENIFILPKHYYESYPIISRVWLTNSMNPIIFYEIILERV